MHDLKKGKKNFEPVDYLLNIIFTWMSKNTSFFSFLFRLNLDPDVPQNQLYIAEMMKSLIQEVEIKAASLTNPEYFLTSSALAEAAKTLKVGSNSGTVLQTHSNEN